MIQTLSRTLPWVNVWGRSGLGSESESGSQVSAMSARVGGVGWVEWVGGWEETARRVREGCLERRRRRGRDRKRREGRRVWAAGVSEWM